MMRQSIRLGIGPGPLVAEMTARGWHGGAARARPIGCLLAAIVIFSAIGAGPAEARPTYVASCSNTAYLAYKPKYWSSGCTGSSANVRPIRWKRWTRRVAFARGNVGINDCDPSCAEGSVYEYPTKLRFSRSKSCRTPKGERVRYFSRVLTWTLFPSGNPFGFEAGWDRRRWSVSRVTPCRFAPG